MDKPLKERLFGALVLVSLAVIFIPMMFDEPKSGTQAMLASNDLPAAPQWPESAVEFTVPESLRTATITPDALVTPQTTTTASDTVVASVQAQSPSEQVAAVQQQVAAVIAEKAASVAPSEDGLKASKAVPRPAEEGLKARATVSERSATQVANAATTSALPPVEPKKSLLPPRLAEIPTLEKPEAYAVQLAIFSNKENAKVLMERLRSKGYDAYVREAFGEGNRIRVLVGPRIERKKAEQLRDKLSAEFALNGFIVPYQPIEG